MVSFDIESFLPGQCRGDISIFFGRFCTGMFVGLLHFWGQSPLRTSPASHASRFTSQPAVKSELIINLAVPSHEKLGVPEP